MSARPRQCPVELLEPGDVIRVYVCIENDEWDYVERTVLAVEELRDDIRPGAAGPSVIVVRYRVPDGWEGGGEYVRKYPPGKTERLAFADVPLLWEGDDS